jgi:hypothetical protein
MRLLSLFVVFLVMNLEVRVRASVDEHHASEKHAEKASHDSIEVTEPSETDVAPKSDPAPIKTNFEILSSETGRLDKNRLLSGDHWFRRTRDYVLKTPYGDIQSIRGDFFVQYENKKVSVVNNLGKLKLYLRDGSIVEVPPGFEIWFSEIKEDRKNSVGFIQPVELKDYILSLGKLWNDRPEWLKDEILNIQARWGDRNQNAARYYKSLAQRKLASIQKEKNRVESFKQQEASRRAANRKLYFERTFGR